MSLSINTEPNKFTPGKNPVRLELATDDYITTDCVKTSAQFNIDSDMVNVATLQIQWGSNDFTFTFSDAEGNFNIPKTYTGKTRWEWIRDLILPKIQTLFTLMDEFDVWAERTNDNAGVIKFQARECGTADIDLTFADVPA
jgi:hypothetical protein